MKEADRFRSRSSVTTTFSGNVELLAGMMCEVYSGRSCFLTIDMIHTKSYKLYGLLTLRKGVGTFPLGSGDTSPHLPA